MAKDIDWTRAIDAKSRAMAISYARRSAEFALARGEAFMAQRVARQLVLADPRAPANLALLDAADAAPSSPPPTGSRARPTARRAPSRSSTWGATPRPRRCSMPMPARTPRTPRPSSCSRGAWRGSAMSASRGRWRPRCPKGPAISAPRPRSRSATSRTATPRRSRRARGRSSPSARRRPLPALWPGLRGLPHGRRHRRRGRRLAGDGHGGAAPARGRRREPREEPPRPRARLRARPRRRSERPDRGLLRGDGLHEDDGPRRDARGADAASSMSPRAMSAGSGKPTTRSATTTATRRPARSA